MITRSQPNIPRLLLIIALTSVFFFSMLWMAGLHDPDETRYAEIAREMLESGDFVVPQFEYLPYLDKPPLSYWATCLAYKIFGINEFAARFFPALSGLGGVIAVYLFGCAMFGEEAGFRAAIILCTSALYFFLSQTLVMDMVLTFFVTLAVGFLYLAYKQRSAWLIPAYLSMALGAMTKGPIGVILPMIPMAAFVMIREGVKGVRKLISIGGILTFLIIWAPWHIAIYFARPEFFSHFYLSENILGFLTKEVHHPRPAYYSIAYLLFGFIPWTLLLPASIEASFRLKDEQREASILCFFWAGSIVLFFTISVSKLPTYILPAFPALALAVGATIPRTEKPSVPARIISCLLGIALCASITIIGLSLSRRAIGIVLDLHNFCAIFLIFCVLLTAVLTHSANRLAFTLGMLFMPFLLAFVLVVHSPRLLESHSGREIAEVISERGDLREVVLFGQERPNLSFYLHRRQIIADRVPRQFWLGLSLGDGSGFFISKRKLAAMAARQSGIYCIVEDRRLTEFEREFRYYFRFIAAFDYAGRELLFVSTGKPSDNAPSMETLSDWPDSALKVFIHFK